MASKDPFIADPVFTVPDNTDSPEAVPGWTAQSWQNGNAMNPGENTTRVFPTKDTTNTPMNAPGWTVQNAGTGSDQNTVTGA